MHAKWLEFDRDQWTLERFLVDPFFTDFHSQILYGSRLRDYAAVGVLERMEESMALFGRTFPEFTDLVVPQLRVSPHNKPEISAELDPAVVARFKARNARDYALYAEANRRLDAARHA